MADDCGIKCKLGKSFLGVQNSIKKVQDDTRKKKADRYGVSLADYDKAVSEARTKGKKVAYGKFLKDVEKKEYLVKSNKGGKSTKSTIDQILDSFAGTQTTPKRRKTTTKRKTPSKAGKYTIIGGIAYPLATNKSKKRRKQKSKRKPKDDWLGDLGVNF